MSEQLGQGNGNGSGHEAMQGSGAPQTAPYGPAAMPEAELRALEAEASVLLARMQFMRQAGVSFKGLRDLYEVLGYDREITTEQYRERYERGGIAGTIVDVMVDATWRGGMWLEEDEDPEKDTPFESAWEELEERLNLSTYMIRADRLARLSDYAVLLIGTSLDGDLTTELPRGKPENLIYLQPYSGAGGPTKDGRQLQTQSIDARAKIVSYEKDAKNPRYGQPDRYSLRLDGGEWIGNVHWSRIVHVAEGCLDDDVFGRSVLKRCWNNLDDLDKLAGGGSEAFWLRANQGMHVNIDKDMQLDAGAYADVVTKLKAQSELYKHQQTRWLQTRGVDVNPLGSDVANFGPNLDAVLKLISGTTRIPTRILTGSEMGELASSQDRENFKDQINGRQEQNVGPNLVRRVADRFIAYGYLPTPAAGPRKYKVKSAHIQTLTEQEKVDGAKGWATTNQTQGEVVFTDAEIRQKWADKAPLTDEQRQEIADRKAEAVKVQQEAMAAAAPAAPPEKKPNPFMRAAGDLPGHEFHGNQWKNSGTIEQVGDYPPTFEHKLDGGWSVGWSEQDGVPGTWKAHPTGDRSNIKYFKSKGAAYSFASKRPYRIAEAEDTELLRVLEAAIVAGNQDVVMRIVGLGDVPGHEFHGNQWSNTAPLHGEPGSPERMQYVAWEHGKTWREKENKLIAIKAKDPKDVNWGRDWEADTRVRSISQAQDEIDHFKDREQRAKETAASMRSAQAGPHTYGTTQVQFPPDVAAKLFAIPIDDADFYEPEGGRETDAHVTLKYGLLEADPAKLDALLANHGAVSFTLGKTSMFAAPDYDVVFVEVNGPDLADLRADIELAMDCRPDDHGAYRPHATVAYIVSGKGLKYTGFDALDGVVVTAGSIVMSDADGTRTQVSLLDQPLKALGDIPGHEFHGNQYGEGSAGLNADGSRPHKDSSEAKLSKAATSSAEASTASARAHTTGAKADHLAASRARTPAEAAHRTAMHEAGRGTDLGKAARVKAEEHAKTSDEHFQAFKNA